jgi:hypothetical protein
MNEVIMSTEPVYCFEHAPTHTIVRSTIGGSEVQVIRDHKILKSYPVHLNYQVSFAPDGQIYVVDDYGHGNLIDLNLPVLQDMVECVADGQAFYPDGKHILDYDIYNEMGVVKRNITTGETQILCPWEDLAHPHPILIFDQPQTILQKKLDSLWDITRPIQVRPRAYVAEDGETWAFLSCYRAEIGRGNQHLASVYWHEHSFYCGGLTFDLPNGRCILAGEPGLVALSLTGEVLTDWQAYLPCEPHESWGSVITQQKAPVFSPVVFWNGELQAVTEVRHDQQNHRWFEIMRFDPNTLQPLGKLAGFPRRYDEDKHAGLLALADGSLAWVPHNQPLIILPAPGVERQSSDVVRVLVPNAPPRISPPYAGWYDAKIGATGDTNNLSKLTPEQRHSLAYYLLNQMDADSSFTGLLDMDPFAFSPYLDLISSWNFEQLKLLRLMDPQNYWKIMRGASDEVVERIAKPIWARIARQRKFSPEDKLRAMLVIGAGTPFALAQLGDLARQSDGVSELCAGYHLLVPPAGPAIQRCTPDYWDVTTSYKDNVTGHQAGLEYPLPHAEFLPEIYGWSCRSAQGHILTAALDRLPGQPLADSPLRYQHWFLPSGDCCDERKKAQYAYRHLPGSDKQVELVANLALPHPADRPKTGCAGDGSSFEAPPLNYYLVLKIGDPDLERWSYKKLGRLGGYPEWRQSPQIPVCPECDRMMFYVGWVKADTLRHDLPDLALYGFHCEQCGLGVQIIQK